MNQTHSGREALAGWLRKQPSSFYESAPLLRRLQESAWEGEDWSETRTRLENFGRVAAQELDAWVIENNEGGHLPHVLDVLCALKPQRDVVDRVGAKPQLRQVGVEHPLQPHRPVLFFLAPGGPEAPHRRRSLCSHRAPT